MTISGTVNRWARLRAPGGTATVTRVTPETGAPVYLVETSAPDGPTFTPCATWRIGWSMSLSSVRFLTRPCAAPCSPQRSPCTAAVARYGVGSNAAHRAFGGTAMPNSRLARLRR